MDFRIVRPVMERVTKTGGRLVQPPQDPQRVAQIVVRLRVVRAETDRRAETGDRLVKPPLFLQHGPRLLWASG